MIASTHVSTKYQVVIPKKIRNVFPLSPREELTVYVEDENRIVLQKEKISIKNLRGSGSFSKNYLKKERLSW